MKEIKDLTYLGITSADETLDFIKNEIKKFELYKMQKKINDQICSNTKNIYWMNLKIELVTNAVLKIVGQHKHLLNTCLK